MCSIAAVLLTCNGSDLNIRKGLVKAVVPRSKISTRRSSSAVISRLSSSIDVRDPWEDLDVTIDRAET